MLSRIRTAFGYWLIWILIFQLSRLLFVLYNLAESRNHSYAGILQSFYYGLKMDVSMASYILLPVCIFLTLGIFIPYLAKPNLYKIYSGIILLPALLIICCDLPAYKAWGIRLDAGPLRYLSSPREAWASVSNLPVFWILLGLILVYLLLYRLCKRYFNAMLPAETHHNKWLQLVLLLLFTAAQIIPLRGGFQLAPLNQSSVYFSKENYLNLAAINVNWHFMQSLTRKNQHGKNPYKVYPDHVVKPVLRKLLTTDTAGFQMINRGQHPNPDIILIIWESFTAKAVDNRWKGVEITPGFNKLKKEGIYFSDCYASGDRTDKGIAAVLSGYPAQPTTSIIKTPQKTNTLARLPEIYRKKGYQTSFYYGGELEFANMKAYLLGSGFDQFTSKDDFDAAVLNSKWGAHDGAVAEKVYAGLTKKTSPFFCTWLTLSSHEPFETPVEKVIEGTDDESLFLNAIHYADSCIYAFVEKCKQLPNWNNTLVLIVADHGHRLPASRNRIDDFKVPFLVTGGALAQRGITVTHTSSQSDIATTLLQQTGEQGNPFPFGKNMFQPGNAWAYFSFNNGFGYVQPGKYLLYDNVGKSIFEQAGTADAGMLQQGQILQQETVADFLSR